MHLSENLYTLISTRLDQLPVGSEFQLAELFGDEWSKIGTAGQKRNVGTMFSRDVADGFFPCVQFVRIERAGRANTYIRLDLGAG